MTSYNIYTPYFYIIRHKPTGKMYAGSKWAKGCTPDNFMKDGGYTTSSKTINNIITQEGIDVFEILRLDTNCDELHPYDYETLFLETNDCASSDEWFNGHNNKYSLENNWSEKARTKRINTNFKKYGVESVLQASSVREKIKLTNIDKYGVENASQNPDVRLKINQTIYLIYSVDNISQSSVIKDKKKQTCLENHGVEYYSQHIDYRKEVADTCMEKYGVDHQTKAQCVKDKNKITCLENHGVEYALQSDIVRGKGKFTMITKYGVDNAGKMIFVCPHCNTEMKGRNAFKYHFEYCIENPNALSKKKLEGKECEFCNAVIPSNNITRHVKYCIENPNAEIKKPQKRSELRQCPHCGVQGRGAPMTKHHFDKCKHKLAERA